MKRRIVADSICADVWVATEPSSSASATPDAGTGEYGARMLKDVDGAFDVAVRPFGEWAHIKPTWIGEAGEGDIKAIASYLNRRIWRPSADVEIFVQELRSQRQQHWPRNLAEASGPAESSGKVDRRWNRRQVRGARHFIVDAIGPRGRLSDKGSLVTRDRDRPDACPAAAS